VFDTPIAVHHLGPRLMHSFSLEATHMSSFSDVVNGDWICFCLGEIDARCHIKRHTNSITSYHAVIDALVARYDTKLIEIAHLFDSITVCVFMIPPPPKEEKVCSNDWGYFPLCGTDQERLEYAQYFNVCLRQMCKNRGFYFIEAYSEYADEEGFLSDATSDKIVHLKFPDPVRQIIFNLVAENSG